MQHDQITIFVPVKHFHEAFLREALRSVLVQTRTDWRLLIVVHAEDEPVIGRAIAGFLGDPRVRLVHRAGRRLAGAYNSAMRAAETEFIVPLLGDDLLARDAVEILGDSVRSYPEADFFHSGRYFIDHAGRRLSSDYLPPTSVRHEDFVTRSPVKHLLCWRVSLGLACGGVDETLDNFGSDDYDFPWTMLEYGAVFHAIPKALYAMRDHREGYRLTTHLPRDVQQSGLRRILAKHGVPRRTIDRVVRRAARSYMKQSLFRNEWHRWFRDRIGFDAYRGWREPYR
jgi:glycosyltransferase involved in cell wall biosynthesis